MRNKRNADGGTISSGLFIAVAVIAALVIIGVVIYFVNTSKSSATRAGSQFNEISSTYGQAFKKYDNAIVSGNEVIEAIKNNTDTNENVTITVKTKMNSSGKTYAASATPTPVPTSPTVADYINPDGNFRGEVEINSNGYITKVTFTQQ